MRIPSPIAGSNASLYIPSLRAKAPGPGGNSIYTGYVGAPTFYDSLRKGGSTSGSSSANAAQYRLGVAPKGAPRSSSGSANAAEHKLGVKSASTKAKPKASSSSSSAASSRGGGSGGGFGGGSFGGSVGAGGTSGGSSNPYLDIIGSLKDDKTFTDYMSEANKIYKPSMDYLNQQKTDVSNRSGQYDQDLAGMYQSLVGNINAQNPVIGQNYDSAINQQNQITGNATAAVGDNYARSQAQQMAMLKQLGVEAAAPDTLQTGQDSQAFFQSLLGAQGANQNQFLNSQKVASQDFNTAQSNIAGQTGANARTDLKMQTNDILGQLAGKGADLQTQINQQAAQMQSGAAQGLLDQQKMLMDAVRYNTGDQLDMAKFQETMSNNQANLGLKNATLQAQIERDRANAELGAAKLSASTSKSSAPKIPSNPWGNAAQIAMQLYGNQQQAGSAIDAIQSTIRLYPDLMNQPSSALLSKVLSRVSPTGKPTGGGDTASLQSLVDYIYKQLKG